MDVGQHAVGDVARERFDEQSKETDEKEEQGNKVGEGKELGCGDGKKITLKIVRERKILQ